MAILNSDDFTFYKRHMASHPTGDAEMKAADLSSPQTEAGFQALEDGWIRAALKGAVEAAIGKVMTDALYDAFVDAWMARECEKSVEAARASVRGR